MKATTILISCAFLGGAAFVHAGEKGFGDGTLPDFLAAFDANEDGVLDEEEVQAMKAARKQAREEKRDAIDTNDDGKISLQERERAREEMQQRIEAKRAEKFAEIAGEDGLLTLAEFSAIPALADVDPARLALMFARLDGDGSGEVTLEEFTARLRRHRGDGPGNGDGEPTGNGPRPRPGDGPGGPGGPGEGDGDGAGPGDGGGDGPGPGGEPRDGSGDGVPDGPRR
jgi:Ca2+-binding EF-hand superfamily protein